MDYVKEAAGKWDEVVESFGVKVFIDPRALLHIVGSTMDFVDDHVRALHSFSPSINRRVCFRPL
jgi:iron-sulfur cluster assembly 1